MKILDIFISPKTYFLSLKEKPHWIIPLIIILTTAILSTFVATRYIRFADIAERMRERGASEEEIERVKTYYQSPAATAITLVSVLITTVIFLLILTLVLNFALPLFGSEGIFPLTFALIVNTGLVSALGNIFRSGIILIQKTPRVSTNLSLFLPSGLKKTFWFALLSQLDFFIIWQMILLGLGLTLFYDLKGKKGYYLVFGLYIIWIIFATLLFRRSPMR